MANLNIGIGLGGKPFTLPADLTDKKIAMLAQSNMGKTYGLGVILEELLKAQRPFIATDPANNLWGLRTLRDGRPSHLPVIIVGGDHADIPLEKNAGERLAEALISEPVCAVIDTAFESMGTVRHFMADFAGRLMRSKPEGGRVIILEECPTLIPQKAFGPQMEICKAAVVKLLTIGGNFGYGVIPASQRPATIDKDALSQCEALIVMGISHKADRDAIRGWMDAKDIGDRAEACFDELGSLKKGEAWLWWPDQDRFEKFMFRQRETLHPREMQKLGLKASTVQLGDAQAFVEKVRKELTKTVVAAYPPPAKLKTAKALMAAAAIAVDGPPPARQLHEQAMRMDELQRDLELKDASIARLQEELDTTRGQLIDASTKIGTLRAFLRPQFESLQKLFSEIGEASPAAAGGEISEAWAQWLSKAGTVGCKGMLEILIKRGRMKQVQLATLAGVKFGGSTWRAYRSWITRNHLAKLEGEEIQAAAL